MSLLTVESDLVNSIDYDDVIGTFAEYKARRKQMHYTDTYRDHAFCAHGPIPPVTFYGKSRPAFE